MSVYAPVPTYVEHKRHSRALFLIIAGHAALIAAVMTAKMDLPGRFMPAVTHVKLIPLPPEPHPNPPPRPRQQHEQNVSQVQQVVPIPQPADPQVDLTPYPIASPDPGPVIGAEVGNSVVRAEPVRVGPRFITPQSDVKPPYPARKLRDGAEAVLRLRLSIDDRGRVVAVDPVGTADPVFLAAARKHLLAHWRYRPATEDGRAVATSTVITLRFELGD
jgi:protein TonB